MCTPRVWASLLFMFILGCTSASREQSNTQAPETTQKATSAPERLRILSYNIHHGEGTDGRLDLPRIAQVIRAEQPDLVALQEVDDRTARTHGLAEAAELAKLTGMVASFGQAMAFQGGGYGQAILSKRPLPARTVQMLPQRANREPRIVLAGHVSTIGHDILFASTHLDHQEETIRLEQAQRLNTTLRTNLLPVILAGDFNAVPESETMKVFSSDWRDAGGTNPQPTIPSNNPRHRIDYILLYPAESWRVLETRVLDEPVASDHRPIVATVELISR